MLMPICRIFFAIEDTFHDMIGEKEESIMEPTNEIRFGLMTDVHHDLIPDGPERLSVFIDRMKREQTDFIIQLGDFCFPYPENRPFLQLWEQFSGPKYHVLGNHDMDKTSKKTVLEFLGMDSSYYAFDAGEYHFIVLDTNFIKVNGAFIDYDAGNYFKHSLENINYVSDEQLEWLKEDLKKTNKKTILFSHQSLEYPQKGKTRGIHNSSELRAILREANEQAGFRKVVACFNGHSHIDGVKVIDDIYFIDINSMSYLWMGAEYKTTRYSEEITAKYRLISHTAPYRDPLYAIVTLKPGSLIIQGTETEYVGPSPVECGYSNVASGHLIAPKISSRNLLI
jgi:3',5'-cyclic AMP phosphodiesterase CpdA